MSGDNLVSVFLQRVAERGDHGALLIKQQEQFVSITWNQLFSDVSAAASVLDQLDVEPGNRVALVSENRYEWIVCDLAIQMTGAVHVPIHSTLSAEQVVWQIEHSGSNVVLLSGADQATKLAQQAESKFAKIPILCFDSSDIQIDGQKIQSLRSMMSSTVAADLSIWEQVARTISSDDLATILYTSGTTGEPKGALLPHRKALYNSRNAEEYFAIESSDRVLVAAPLFHSLGLLILALPATFKGAGLILQQGFSAARVWTAIESESVTYFGGVPTLYQRLLEALESGEPLSTPPSCLRFAFSAGAAAAPEMIQAFHEHGLLIRQGYGQTETSILTCLDARYALEKAGSVGRPVRHAELRLVDPETIEREVGVWRDVAPGQVGEIVVRGPITMLGYWQRPAATAETLREGWVRTGDLATRDEEFDLTLVGRSREMYISGGENVYPAEVEATLIAHPEIDDAAVVAVPDPEWGEAGRAHIVLTKRATIEPALLLEWLKTRLARFKQPREIILETELPRTASGKVQKHRLGKTVSNPKGQNES